MRPCQCSLRALEVFVKDFSGLNLRQPPTRRYITSNERTRHFSAAPRLRLVEPAKSYSANDEFIPFELEHEGGASASSSKDNGTPPTLPNARQMDRDDLDDEWHAEIEIVAPWPQEINPSNAARFETIQGMVSEEIEAQSDQLERELLELNKNTRPVDDTSFQNPENRNNAIVIPPVASLQPPEPALEHGSTVISAPQRSRAENRQERKLRRLQEGTYRREAEMRLRARLEDGQLSSALRNIEAMEDNHEGKAEDLQSISAEQTRKGSGPNASKQKTLAKSSKKTSTTAEGKNSKPLPSKTSVTNWITPQTKPKKEAWQTQKEALKSKFGEQGWQPRKRVSPDTLDGIRALHASDPTFYTTQTLSEHFKITPEAIRRILKSKWRPNTDEMDKRRLRWEKRGERKWTAMAEQGTRPPAKWRAKGITNVQASEKRIPKRKDDAYVQWQDEPRTGTQPSLSDRIL